MLSFGVLNFCACKTVPDRMKLLLSTEETLGKNFYCNIIGVAATVLMHFTNNPQKVLHDVKTQDVRGHLKFTQCLCFFVDFRDDNIQQDLYGFKWLRWIFGLHEPKFLCSQLDRLKARSHHYFILPSSYNLLISVLPNHRVWRSSTPMEVHGTGSLRAWKGFHPNTFFVMICPLL